MDEVQQRNRTIQLFAAEAYGGQDSILWKNPLYFSQPGGQSGKMMDQAFDEWKAGKRAFSAEEITNGFWIKVREGFTFVVRCFPDGTLTERALLEDGSWDGTWQLIGDMLRMNIGEYELDICANKNSSIHSGIEFMGDKYVPHTYYKVVHLV